MCAFRFLGLTPVCLLLCLSHPFAIQFDAAAAALEPLVAAHPQCVEAVRLLGCVYAMSVAADADSNTNGASNANAAVSASAASANANALKPHQKAERAKALLKRSLAVHASDADAWLRLGEVCAATDPTAAYQVRRREMSNRGR